MYLLLYLFSVHWFHISPTRVIIAFPWITYKRTEPAQRPLGVWIQNRSGMRSKQPNWLNRRSKQLQNLRAEVMAYKQYRSCSLISWRQVLEPCQVSPRLHKKRYSRRKAANTSVVLDGGTEWRVSRYRRHKFSMNKRRRNPKFGTWSRCNRRKVIWEAYKMTCSST